MPVIKWCGQPADQHNHPDDVTRGGITCTHSALTGIGVFWKFCFFFLKDGSSSLLLASFGTDSYKCILMPSSFFLPLPQKRRERRAIAFQPHPDQSPGPHLFSLSLTFFSALPETHQTE
jgi:hypothetical protein